MEIRQAILDSKIIVVDDSYIARKMLCAMLKKMGFTNYVDPETSIEAWELIAEAQLGEKPFDLVITDLNMPGLDGMDLVEKIKEDELSKDLKVMVISGDADQIIINVIKSMGAEDYLVKPVKMEELGTAIVNVLDVKQAA